MTDDTIRYTEGEWFAKTILALEAYYRYHGIKRDDLPDADTKFLERLCVGLLQLALEKTAHK